ncbi:hypothetical protein LPJ66_000503 [Kickxella alabastrina]|uniref:Uncharacterized protein n=1 Tax=Kickxella alabastrina TaxID=61397 RepID=A0ACC1IW27_9FUNG|nr:hypothetical protein LPJ66_000503 [Kickxella alabastrina]
MSCVICCESLFEHINKLDTSGGDKGSKGVPTDWQEQPSVLSCGHVFHQGCISAWLAQSNRSTCPTCRTKHSGNPITLFFEVDAPGEMDANGEPEVSIAQVQHRNKVIRTLCANVESAQSETKNIKAQLEAAEAKYLEECRMRGMEASSGRLIKDKAASYKKIASDFKTYNMRLEKTVAEQARQIEVLQNELATTSAELQDQKRVVLSMGDVRSTNEQLVRTLKKEKSRNETVVSINGQLASKVADLELQISKNSAGVGRSASGQSAQQDRSMRADAPADENASYHVVTDTDTDLEEDAAAVGSSVAAAWNRTRVAKPPARLTSTFEMPLAAFGTAKEPAGNPFAALPSNGVKPKQGEFTFSFPADSTNLNGIGGGNAINNGAGQPIEKSHSTAIFQLARPSRSLAYPLATSMSDGLGGSRRRAGLHNGKRSTTSVQARINWGPKKQ